MAGNQSNSSPSPEPLADAAARTAQNIVDDVKSFQSSASSQAYNRLAQDWLSAVKSGHDYMNTVSQDVKQIMPEAILTNGGIEFLPTSPWLGAHIGSTLSTLFGIRGGEVFLRPTATDTRDGVVAWDLVNRTNPGGIEGGDPTWQAPWFEPETKNAKDPYGIG